MAWRTTARDPAARETSIDISVGVQDIAGKQDKQDNKTEMGSGFKSIWGCMCFRYYSFFGDIGPIELSKIKLSFCLT
jgi:hypothetical protein